MSYIKITYREEGAKRAKTVILKDAVQVEMFGVPCWSGTEVDAEGNVNHAAGVDTAVRVHVIEAALATKAVEVRMNNHYGMFEEIR